MPQRLAATMPTDAQIEAARVVLRDKYQIWLSPIAIKDALAAAESAAAARIRELEKQRDAAEVAMRERCAQAVDAINWVELTDGNATDALMHAVAVIRDLPNSRLRCDETEKRE